MDAEAAGGGAVEPDLDKLAARPILDDPTRAAIEAMRGDLAFARGQYAKAREHFDAALERSSSILAKLALWHWRTGEFDEAEARYREAETLLLGEALEPRAWTQLQLGIMDLERGRYEDAFAHYRDGAAILGGWWLLEEHIAEIAALLEVPEFALATPHVSADLYWIAAQVLAAHGDEQQAATLRGKATALNPKLGDDD